METDANNLKAQIHIARTQLEMEEEAYRALLKRVTGKASASARDLTLRQLIDVRDEMKRLGFVVRSKKHPKPKAGNDKQALVDKVGALLAEAGRPWDYLTAKTEKCRTKDSPRPMSLLERITGKTDLGREIGKERIEFCSATDLRKIVAALEYDRRRRAA